jgi:hypothetical protein
MLKRTPCPNPVAEDPMAKSAATTAESACEPGRCATVTVSTRILIGMQSCIASATFKIMRTVNANLSIAESVHGVRPFEYAPASTYAISSGIFFNTVES